MVGLAIMTTRKSLIAPLGEDVAAKIDSHELWLTTKGLQGEQGDFAGAEVRLRRLVTSDDSVIAASALKRLGELLLEFGQPADAATSFARMERDLAEAVLIDGRSAAQPNRKPAPNEPTAASASPPYAPKSVYCMVIAVP